MTASLWPFLATIAGAALTGYLFDLVHVGSTPGGMDVMVTSAMDLGGDRGMVLAMRMTRWFLGLMAGPWVAVRLVQRARKTA